MSPISRYVVFLFIAALARSQTPAPAAPPPAPRAPAPGTHSHAVLLDAVVTSASPFQRNQVELAQTTTVLSGRELLVKQQSTLGETLASETGMSATSFGPGASRPIIRGLGGDRIRLLENSVGTLDASVISPDHAASVEPFLVERVEIVRGPAALLFGSAAVGGVVNVITHRIETELPTERVRGGGEVRIGSGASEFSRGAVLDVAVGQAKDRALVLHLDGFRRRADDLRIPGFVESARVRAAEASEAEEHGETLAPPARERLPNSSLSTESGAVGLSLVTDWFHTGISYSGLDSNYGVPGHAHGAGARPEAAGVRIDLHQRRTDVQGEWRLEENFIHALRLKFGQADYRHAEIEPTGDVGTLFTNRGHDARLELLHGTGNWQGAIGAQSSRSRFAAVGDEAFLPSSLTRSAAVFAFEEIARGAATVQLGLRGEQTEITPTGGTTRRSREASGSLGLLWKRNASDTLAFTAAHTGRAANVQELFADGAHTGTQAFEIGNPDLGAERALNLELSFRRRTPLLTGSLTLFTNRFRGHIFPKQTGERAVEGLNGWGIVPPAAGRLPTDETLPVYRYVAGDARFWGAELETLWHVPGVPRGELDLKVAGDFTRARGRGENLPRIPAPRTTLGLAWTEGIFSLGVDAQFTFAQKRTAPNETSSRGYTALNAHAAWALAWGKFNYELFLRATNLLDEEMRPHPSFAKELAPLGGRAGTAGLRLSF